MSSCDKCNCFDEDAAENADYPEGLTEEQEEQWLEEQEDYQPDRYYYWHGDIQEDYQMPEGYECLCESCFGDFLNTGELFEKYLDNGKINPIWNDSKHGYFTPVCEKTS